MSKFINFIASVRLSSVRSRLYISEADSGSVVPIRSCCFGQCRCRVLTVVYVHGKITLEIILIEEQLARGSILLSTTRLRGVRA